MGALLVSLAAAGILMSAALPIWSQAARREREAELVFRGEQYARAVALYQRINAGAFPPDVETLIDERFLRRRYRDPMVEDGEFRILRESDAEELLGGAPAAERPGETPESAAANPDRPASTPAVSGRSARNGESQGGITGVVSTSAEASLRVYNGATRYDQWVFLYSAATATPDAAAGRSSDVGRGAPGPAEPARPNARDGLLEIR